MSSSIQTLTSAQLRGDILKVIYQSEDESYAVLRVRDGEGHEYTVRGPVGGLAAGQHLEAVGKWEKHDEYGYQFHAESYRITLPSSPEGIKRFLASGIIPGIGEKTAGLIVDYFGEKTLSVLDNASARLLEIPHIGKKKAQSVIDGWKKSEGRRDGMIFLQGLGITPAYCAKLYTSYGDSAPEIVRKNPFRLAEEVNGIGFARADAIAASLGLDRTSPERLTAGAVYSLNRMIAAGHVCAPREELARSAAELLEVTPEAASQGIDNAIGRRLLRQIDGDIYTMFLARAELDLPQQIFRLTEVENFAGRRMAELPFPSDCRLSAGQRLAVEMTGKAPLSIITGGPGVGKTTVIGEIVARAVRAGLAVLCAAPTGRAAKRLSESTRLPGKTIHRLLQYEPHSGRFLHGPEDPLGCDLLIVDEVSMLDLPLAYALFRALRTGCSVVLVGDADQLPSVGPGTVLASFLASGRFAVCHLTEVFRQSANSRIVLNAHRVNHGLLPERVPPLPPGVLSDFYWIEQDDPEKVVEVMDKLLLERIPRRFHFDPVSDVQILSPMNRGNCGTVGLNEHFAHLLNPGDKPQFRFGEKVFRAGDKVMQLSNNYDHNVFNGDLGRISRILAKEKKFQVVFDRERMVEYEMEECEQLTLAYAVTVHKSQGCEFPVVVLPMLSQHYMMLQRNLLYTAMTRAKKLLLLIGGERAIKLAVDNVRLEPRYSNLAALLQRH